MAEPLVIADKLGRTYGQGEGKVVALAAASCTVLPGSRVAIVGPSGSGKSTLLQLLGGLDQPSSGQISWPALGAASTLRPAKIAFIFQVPSLLAPLTAIENVELPLLLGRIAAKAARAAALDALDRLDLAAIADKLPEELSGGQAQRVAVARALAYRPRLILADEPTGQLDRATANHLLDVLLAQLQGSDTALVVATHDLTVAALMTEVWQMQYGTLEVNP